jgi:hypothetical protein
MEVRYDERKQTFSDMSVVGKRRERKKKKKKMDVHLRTQSSVMMIDATSQCNDEN